jgi:hypothetical protein
MKQKIYKEMHIYSNRRGITQLGMLYQGHHRPEHEKKHWQIIYGPMLITDIII